MRIKFLDVSGWDYNADTPAERPFGGSQSALVYLSIELVRLGHTVTILNGTSTPGEHRGVQFVNFKRGIPNESFNECDVLIIQNNACGHRLRKDHGVKVPLVMWNQHAQDQPAVHSLSQADERKQWNGYAFVSQWQLDRFVDVFGLDRKLCCVMRNAVSPAFADLAPVTPWFVAGQAPALVYTSTPFRGLDVLIAAFPKIRAAIPGTRLRIYSSMGTYQLRPEEDKFRGLYEQCKATEGAEYIGAIGQSRLAKELAGTAALAYPSTFAETSCIAALEAMAVGAAILTTRLGALPETTGGFAHMIEPSSDKRQLAQDFESMSIEALSEMCRNPTGAAARRETQMKFIRDNYLWPARTREWVDWLSRIVAV